MRVRLALAAAALVAVSVCPVPARGEVLEKTGTFAGLRVTYKVVVPAAYDASFARRVYGRPQTLPIATSTVKRTGAPKPGAAASTSSLRRRLKLAELVSFPRPDVARPAVHVTGHPMAG
jgi:hypothetical protein